MGETGEIMKRALKGKAGIQRAVEKPKLGWIVEILTSKWWPHWSHVLLGAPGHRYVRCGGLFHDCPVSPSPKSAAQKQQNQHQKKRRQIFHHHSPAMHACVCVPPDSSSLAKQFSPQTISSPANTPPAFEKSTPLFCLPSSLGSGSNKRPRSYHGN